MKLKPTDSRLDDNVSEFDTTPTSTATQVHKNSDSGVVMTKATPVPSVEVETTIIPIVTVVEMDDDNDSIPEEDDDHLPVTRGYFDDITVGPPLPISASRKYQTVTDGWEIGVFHTDKDTRKTYEGFPKPNHNGFYSSVPSTKYITENRLPDDVYVDKL